MPDPGFEIAGPCQVSITPRAGSVDNLGFTDGESLIGLDVNVLSRPIYTDEGGRVPQEIIHLGMTGLLTMQLVKWDRTVLNDIWYAVPNPALITDGHLNAGVVGKLWGDTSVTGVGFFGVSLIPTLTDSRTVYTFTRCYLPEDGLAERNIGNDATLLQLSFVVLPNTSTNDLYTYSVTSP